MTTKNQTQTKPMKLNKDVTIALFKNDGGSIDVIVSRNDGLKGMVLGTIFTDETITLYKSNVIIKIEKII